MTHSDDSGSKSLIGSFESNDEIAPDRDHRNVTGRIESGSPGDEIVRVAAD